MEKKIEFGLKVPSSDGLGIILWLKWVESVLMSFKGQNKAWNVWDSSFRLGKSRKKIQENSTVPDFSSRCTYLLRTIHFSVFSMLTGVQWLCTYAQLLCHLLRTSVFLLSFCFKKLIFLPSSKKFAWMMECLFLFI